MSSIGRVKVNLMLAELMHEQEYKKRGNAFFRVHGDGILQIIKFEYERCFEHFELNIGLHSMYGELEKQWFTSSGCIPRYCVLQLIGQKTAVCRSPCDGFPPYVVSPEEQLYILKEKGFEWLDAINTQETLATSLCFLDKRWNDDQKIAPYLSSGQLDLADKVVNAILYQHICANIHNCDWNITWSEEDFARYVQLFPGKDRELICIHNWISNNDRHSIQNYLNRNYEKNKGYARFCL